MYIYIPLHIYIYIYRLSYLFDCLCICLFVLQRGGRSGCWEAGSARMWLGQIGKFCLGRDAGDPQAIGPFLQGEGLRENTDIHPCDTTYLLSQGSEVAVAELGSLRLQKAWVSENGTTRQQAHGRNWSLLTAMKSSSLFTGGSNKEETPRILKISSAPAASFVGRSGSFAGSFASTTKTTKKESFLLLQKR